MGRYAYFSTGFDYKFYFGVQASEDILMFGGWRRLKRVAENTDNDYDDDNGYVRWTREEDLDYIRARLDEIGYPIPDVGTYEKTLDGLQAFHNDLWESLRRQSDEEDNSVLETKAGFVLGCLIYFQLHMEPSVTAEFEM